MNSYWIDSTLDRDINNPIDTNYNADVCIIGAGICGLTTGYYLSKKGLKVIILDKSTIGKKVSGNTTAKITFQHNLIYDYLINSFGLDFAFKYLEANSQAIHNIKKIIDIENIDCDFEFSDNYIYTTIQEELPKIHSEIKALNILSGYLNNSHSNYNSLEQYNSKNDSDFAQFVTKCELPFKICGGIKIKNQAMFHPRKYMLGLANAISNNKSLIFTNSLVTDVKKNLEDYSIYVNDFVVNSKYVVIASHYPFINFPGLYFSKMYKSTSYAIAVDTHKKLFNGMYINPSQPVFSYRTAKYSDGELLIVSGGDHKTGFSPNNNNGYEILEKKVREFYPDCDILYKWNTSDCITLDKIPYVGQFSTLMPNCFIATGFNKWGMTSSNVAANILKDEILGIPNKHTEVFDSTRVHPIKNIAEVKNMVSQTAKSFVVNKIKIPEADLSSIEKDNGGIIKINNSKVGIYKDSDGNIYAVDPTCTHLGCLLTWNNLDKTWDCPCHGSRFDFTGKNIYNPAIKNLYRYTIEN